MNGKARTYVATVILAGLVCAGFAAAGWRCQDPAAFASYFAIAIVLSCIKMRLPGLDGTYSFSALLVLAGLLRFDFSEVLAACCAGAAAQCLYRPRKQPVWYQVAFNIAGMALSITACSLAVAALGWSGLAVNRVALLAVIVCTFFAVNTIVVSGVLSILSDKKLGAVNGEWYLWSFPYYLLGAAIVGAISPTGGNWNAESWLAILPLAYVVHFYCGLRESPSGRATETAAGAEQDFSLPARLYLAAVVAGGVSLMGWSATHLAPGIPLRFLAFWVTAAIASTWKIQLPRMHGTVSLGYVLGLVAITQLSLAEAILIGGTAALVQALWRTASTPKAVQVVFSVASVVIGTAAARYACLELASNAAAIPVSVGIALVTLYSVNTFLVAAVLNLVEGKALLAAWRNCFFWSLPCYLVGGSAAGLMAATMQAAGWASSLLIVPLAGLFYVSYRLQLRQFAPAAVSTRS